MGRYREHKAAARSRRTQEARPLVLPARCYLRQLCLISSPKVAFGQFVIDGRHFIGGEPALREAVS
jgi:hypothetical protein